MIITQITERLWAQVPQTEETEAAVPLTTNSPALLDEPALSKGPAQSLAAKTQLRGEG